MFSKFIRVLVMGIYLSGGSAVAEPSYEMETERWLIRLLSAKVGCVATSVIEAVGGLVVYLEPDGSGTLIIVGDDAANQLVVDKGYSGSRLTIDESRWDVYAFVSNIDFDVDGSAGSFKDSTIVFLGQAPGLWDALSEGQELSGEVGGVPLEKYPLQGSGQAMEYLDECIAALEVE